MVKKDIKFRVNKILWEKALEKAQNMFGWKMKLTDFVLVVFLLALYKMNNKSRSEQNKYLVTNQPNDLRKENYTTKTISVYGELLDFLKENHKNCTNSQALEFALADFLYLPLAFYTDNITSVYTIVGSKNIKMQKATAEAVKKMQLPTKDLTLIDACCATGSLYFGLGTYPWKQVILNDKNPLRTNFLNVLKKEPLKLIHRVLDADLSFIEQPDTKNAKLKEFKDNIENYENKRLNYTKVDNKVEIAYQSFLTQCIDRKYIEKADRILMRVLRFLPANLKLSNATITQQDCLTYLENDIPKLVLLDVPYIGSEKECAIKGYKYEHFHDKVAAYLEKAEYPFIYYCRSSAAKSDRSKSTAEKEGSMNHKLGIYFFDKGFFFQQIKIAEDTELLVSNRNYDPTQITWSDPRQDLILR